MVLRDLDRFCQIVIQTHDNPDADAVGAGYAIYKYFEARGKNVRLVYSGANRIGKSNMTLLVSELDIPIEYVTELDEPELLITVDCQYGQGNVRNFPSRNVAVIDHHNTGRQSDGMAEIRTNLASCCTLCYDLLKNAGYEVNDDLSVATALYYGLYMDSNQLSELRHPLDRDMMDFLQYDKALVSRLKYANFSIEELQTAGIAITNNQYIEKHRTSVVASNPCDPNILGVIGDLVIQVDSVDVCVVYNETPAGYKLSIRSCLPDVAANEVAQIITFGVGNGGGHLTKAGGFISKTAFEYEYGVLGIEEYLAEKIEDYYEGYDVVYYTDDPPAPEKLRRYRKKACVCGYVKSTDLFPQGTEFKIRTLEGDVLVTSDEDIYVMIGFKGDVYPIEKKAFEGKYHAIDAMYTKSYEYEPSVIDISRGTVRRLLPYARQCIGDTGSEVFAMPLEKFTKVFTRWDYEGYMAGNKGDMLCYNEDDDRDVYVVKKDIFPLTYDEVI